MSASKRWIGAAAALLLLSGPALAQQQQPQQQQPDAQAGPEGQAQTGEDGAEAEGRAQTGDDQAGAERGDQIATGPGFRELGGNVAEVSPLVNDLKVVEPETGRIVTLEIGGDTRIVRGGQRIDLEDIRAGAEVRASYTLREGNFIAERIEVSDAPTLPAETVREGTGEVSPTLQVQGRVTDKSDLWDNFKLVDPQRNLAVNIDVVEDTAFTLDGRRVLFETLEPGMEVRATYRLQDDEFVAQQVEILRGPSVAPDGQQAPAEQPQQPAGPQGPDQPQQPTGPQGPDQPPQPTGPQQPTGQPQPEQPEQPQAEP